jgi:phosphoglycerate kinase
MEEKADVEGMKSWLERLLNSEDDFSGMAPEEYLKLIPRVDGLQLLPGTPVLIRCDVDVKVKDGKIGDDSRLKSALETLNYCIQKGWKVIIFGHIGRDPELTLRPVAKRFSELLDREVVFLTDWLDEDRCGLLPEVFEKVSELGDGGVILLENTRKYSIERALWKPDMSEIDETARKFGSIAADFRKVSNVFINEAIASSNRDMSSCILPFSMDKIALGFFFHSEVEKHFPAVRDGELVVFSGLKINKLDHLLGIVKRGKVKFVIAAGAISMALKKAQAEMEGKQFSIGKAEDERFKDEKYYISPERVRQAVEILNVGLSNGVKFAIPEDFILDDRSVSESIPPERMQLDIGPKTMEKIEKVIDKFIEFSRDKRENGSQAVAFHNGVFGRFEEPEFEKGTKWFMGQLKRMSDSSVRVYVGGGEGAKALKKYGDAGWAEHVFTCGGTILTAMTDEPVPPLKALAMKCRDLQGRRKQPI